MQFFQEFLMSSLQPLWSNDGVIIPFDITHELLKLLVLWFELHDNNIYRLGEIPMVLYI